MLPTHSITLPPPTPLIGYPDRTIPKPANGKTLVLADVGPLAFFMNSRMLRIQGTDEWGPGIRYFAQFLLAGGFFREHPWETSFRRSLTHMVMLGDSKPYWRSSYTEDYKGVKKGKRGPKPTGYRPIMDALLEAGGELGYPYISRVGYEADDIAGAVVREFHRGHLDYENVVLWTLDTDWLQLVGEGVYWYNTSDQEPRFRGTPEALEWASRRLKVDIDHPSAIGGWKAVKGDPSDNIPPDSPVWLTDLLNVPLQFAPEFSFQWLDKDGSLAHTVNQAGKLNSETIRNAFSKLAILNKNVWLSY